VTDPVLRLENLARRFSKERAALFEGVNLELRPGEYLAIMGESGVGKSTLLNLLAGLDRPDDGRVLLERRCCAGGRSDSSSRPFMCCPT
jgi:ABC-type nitrate/sulfonate/bicarbonate transport system ATPase subunit